MKQKNKFILKGTIVFIMLLAFTFTSNLNAQGQGNGNVDGPTTGTNDFPGNNGNDKPVGNAGPGGSTSVPIDGGLGILLAGAAIYGVKKLRKS